MAELIVTIDGPAGSGKSTAAKLLAKRLGASFLDTGAMYRTVTIAAMKAGADLGDEEQLFDVLNNSQFRFDIKRDNMTCFVDGEDVTELIRLPQVTDNARYVASSQILRHELVKMQRQIAAGEEKIVTEGRDQGTVAFPDANMKIFLTADLRQRAIRRLAELKEKGINMSIEDVEQSIEDRDKCDINREIGPLMPADDAVIVDTTDLSIEQMVEKLVGIVKEKC
jgi:cytidylate kinase